MTEAGESHHHVGLSLQAQLCGAITCGVNLSCVMNLSCVKRPQNRAWLPLDGLVLQSEPFVDWLSMHASRSVSLHIVFESAKNLL